MAEYTITISDQENGLSFSMIGPAPSNESDASKVALAMIHVAKDIAAKLGEKRGETVRGRCGCPDCQARRDAGQPLSGEVHATRCKPEAASETESNEPKPTLH